MRTSSTIFAFILCMTVARSQEIAFTGTGKKIILFSNGTWASADSLTVVTATLNSPRNLREEFNNAYKFAYDELYPDIFFDNDRKNKAANWAFNSFSSQLYFFAGGRSLTAWYEDMYYIGATYFYNTVYSDDDRHKQTNDWLKTWMDKRTVFDPAYYNSYLARFREAYKIAYNKVYQNEFSDATRRTRSIAWATALLKDK
jgi:hypothetical protein